MRRVVGRRSPLAAKQGVGAPFPRQRHVAQPGAERVGDGVADRGCRRAHRAFAHAERWLVGRIDEDAVNLWHFGEPQDRVAVPGERGNAAGVELYLLLQRPACRHDDAALELVDGAVGIDDQAPVGRTPDVTQAHFDVYLDLDDHSGVGAAVLVAGETDAL